MSYRYHHGKEAKRKPRCSSLDVEYFSFDHQEEGHHHPSFDDFSKDAKARRQPSIYQGEFHCPYPHKRSIQLSTSNAMEEQAAGDSHLLLARSRSTLQNATIALQRSSRRRAPRDPPALNSLRRNSGSSRAAMVMIDDNEAPQDEIFQDVVPHERGWKTPCLAQTSTLDELADPPAPLIVTPIKNTDSSVSTPKTTSTSVSDEDDLNAEDFLNLDEFGVCSDIAPDLFCQGHEVDLVFDLDPLPEDLSKKNNKKKKTQPRTTRQPAVLEAVDADASPTAKKRVAFSLPEFLCNPMTDLDFECQSLPDEGVKTESPINKIAFDLTDSFRCKPSKENFQKFDLMKLSTIKMSSRRSLDDAFVSKEKEDDGNKTPPKTPIYQATASKSENFDISPLTAPCTEDTMWVPSSMKEGAEVESSAQQQASKKIIELDQHTDLPLDQIHNESHRSLVQFFRNGGEETLKLHIDDYQTPIFDRIVESMYGNSTLKTMELTQSPIPLPGSERTMDEMICLFEAMRCLPRLRTLVVSNMRTPLLPALVENLPSSLITLNLQVLEGEISNAILDQLVAKKNLKHLHLEAPQSMEIGRLVKSGSKLESLKVVGVTYTMDPLHMQLFADALLNNVDCPLQNLDLQPIVDAGGWKALAHSLSCSCTKIQSVRVNFLGATLEEKNAAAVDLANLLLVNTTLQCVANYAHDYLIVSEETLSGTVVESLHANTSLLELRFFQEDAVFWMAKNAILLRNQTQPSSHLLRDYFYQPFASFTTILPSVKGKFCSGGHC